MRCCSYTAPAVPDITWRQPVWCAIWVATARCHALLRYLRRNIDTRRKIQQAQRRTPYVIFLNGFIYIDTVVLQHEMLEQGLGVNHLRLILGTSMGCMHSGL